MFSRFPGLRLCPSQPPVFTVHPASTVRELDSYLPPSLELILLANILKKGLNDISLSPGFLYFSIAMFRKLLVEMT